MKGFFCKSYSHVLLSLFTFEIVKVTARVLILILKSCFTLYLTFEKKVLHAILDTLVITHFTKRNPGNP